MLAAIGVSSVEELFRDIPDGGALRGPARPRAARSPSRSSSRTSRSSPRATSTPASELSFLGAGIYDHYVPGGRRRRAPARRVPDRVHAVPAGDEPGRPADDLRVPDRDLRADRDGRLERLRATTARPSPPTPASSPSTRPAGRRSSSPRRVNPQVRQVVKTYAPGFGLEVVEVPHRGGTTDPDELAAAAQDAAAVIFQQPNFFGCLEPAPDLAAAANDAEALPIAHVDPVSLGVLEAPGNYGCAIAIGEGQGAGNYHVVRRPALRLHRRPRRLHPPDAGPDRRRDHRHRRASAASSSRSRPASSTSAARRRPRTSRRTRRCLPSPASCT